VKTLRAGGVLAFSARITSPKIHFMTQHSVLPAHPRSPSSNAAFAPRTQLLALEARTLFDGAGAVAADKPQDADGGHKDTPTDTQARSTQAPDRTPAQDAARTPSDEAASPRREIVFVDPAVTGWEQIVANVRPDVDVVMLDASRNALEQIAETVSTGAPVDAIHIISHGSEGELQLGGAALNLASLPGEATRLAEIGSHLTTDADILLYGCSIAEGGSGAAFLDALSRATSADVAGSTDATGAASRGGNWTLEFETGAVDTTAIRATSFADLLAAPSVTAPTTGIRVAEPSVLNPGGASASTATLSGWTVADDGLGSTTLSVDVTLADPTKGTLGDTSGQGTTIAGGYRLTGTAANLNAWINQITFTAADVELGATAATTSLTVRVTDGEATPLSTSRTIDVTVTPSNDPVLVADGNQAVNENGSTVISAALLPVDPEVTAGTQMNAQIVYRLTAPTTQGYLSLSGTRLGVGSVFTQADVVANRLTYTHTATGATQNTSDSFGVSVNDGATPQASSDTATVTLTITPVNQAPTVGGSGSVFEGQPRNATEGGVARSVVGDFITATGGGDPGDDAALAIAITSLPTHGTLHFSGTATINGVSTTINRDLTAADLTGAGFVIAYGNRSGLTYTNDGVDGAGGQPPADSFNVSVTDAGGGTGVPATANGTVTINVRAVDDDPTWVASSTREATVTALGADNSASTTDDYRVTLTPSMVQALDVDSGDSQLSFVLTQLPASGLILLNNAQLDVGSTFTMDDVRNGRVQYLQTATRADANPSDQFRFQVRDNAVALHWTGAGAQFERPGGIYDSAASNAALTTFAFTVNLVQTTPVYTGPGGAVVPTPAPASTLTTAYAGTDPTTGTPIGQLPEGGTVVLLGDDGNASTPIMLNYTAAGVEPSQIVYTITSLDAAGVIARNGVPLASYGTFTQQDLNDGIVTFTHDGGEDFESSVTFKISAGGGSSSAPLTADNVVFRFYVTPVNDAPTATGGADIVMPEGGTTVITTGQLSFGDPDDANSAEAYLENVTFGGPDDSFALNNGAGGSDPLQFRIVALPVHGALQWNDNGTWVTVTAADVTSQRLFNGTLLTGSSATSGLRYVHDGTEASTDSFGVVARDSRGTESTVGTVAIAVTGINDAPEIARDPTQADPVTAGRSPNNIGGAPVNEPLTIGEEGDFVQLTPAMLQAYDPDSTATQVQYRITTAPAQGRIAYSTNNGVTFTTIGVGSSFTQQDVASGRIFYIHDGTEPSSTGYPGTPDDSFQFTIADGDKEQAGNAFWIYVQPTNDAPVVTAPTGPVVIDSLVAGNNPVPGFSVADADLVSVAPVETDFVQVTVRLLTEAGVAFNQAAYADVTLGYATGAGATVDAAQNGDHAVLTLRGTRAQVNGALAGLTVTFANDRDAIYQVEVLADDRVRDVASGALVDTDAGTAGVQVKANGGALNQTQTPPGNPTAVPATEYDWYSAAVPANHPNIGAKAVAVWASNANDPQTVVVPGAQTPTEDTAFTFSAGSGNAVQIADAESDAFKLPVTLTLAVTDGVLVVGTQTGVTVTGSGTATVTLVGTAADIQARLDAGFTYTGKSQFNGTDTLTVTLTEGQAAVGSDVGSGSVANAPVTQTVALDLVAVNDQATITVPGTPVAVTGNGTPQALAGVSVADASDFSGNSAGVQPGETDFIQVTVRLTDTAGTPITDYTGITFAVAGGATVDATYGGVGAPLVLRGTVATVNTALAGLTVAITGDRDVAYRVQVLADDRTRDANGVLTGGANGGAANQQTGLPAVPTNDTFAADPVNTPTATATALYNVAANAFDLRASSVNDAPVNVLPASLTVVEDAGATTVRDGLNQYIQITDADDFGSAMTVVLTATNGTLARSTTAGVTGALSGASITLTGSKTDVNTALRTLTFTPTANLQGAAGIASISVSTTDTSLDGVAGSNQTTISRLDIAITSANDRPTISNNVTLPAGTEDAPGAGTTISSLPLGYSDATDNQSGATNASTSVSGGNTSTAFSYLAIIGSNSYTAAQGAWQVSDGAGGWITIPPAGLSATNALVFSSNRDIRFVPAGNFFGTPGTLTVVAADASTAVTTSTSEFDTKSLTADGGTTVTGAWSDTGTPRTIGTTVANVNDRPTGTPTTLTATVEDATNPSGATVAGLGFGFGDVTDNQGTGGANITGGGNAATAFGGIAIVGNAANAAAEGVWQYNDNAGSGWVTIGSGVSAPADGSALLLSTTASLRFLPNVANYNGTPGGLTVYVSDSAVTTTASSDISGSLGATSHWSTAVALGTHVTRQNDAPVLTGTAASPTRSENTTTGSGLSVDPVKLVTAGSTVGDLDLATSAGLDSTVFGQGSITVRITDAAGYLAGDVLAVDVASLPGGVLPTGVSVSGGSSADLVISLASGTTLAQVAQLVDAITYRSTSDNPTVNGTRTTRDYSVVVSDGNNQQTGGNAGGPTALSSAPIVGRLTIAPVNDAPVIDLNGAAAGTDVTSTWTEPSNQAHVALPFVAGTLVSDVDNTNLTGLRLVVSGAVDGASERIVLGGRSFALNADQTISDTSGAYSITYVAATGTFTVTPVAGVATTGDLQALVRGLAYVNDSDHPTAGNRSVSMQVTDAGFDDTTGSAGKLVGNTATATIVVVPANDQPVISGLDPVSYFENAINQTAAIIDGAVVLADVDSANFAGGSLAVSGLVAGQDTVSLGSNVPAVPGAVQRNGATVEYYNGSAWITVGSIAGGAGGTLTIGFNANATRDVAQAVVSALTFANSSDTPTLSRTLTLAINDGGTGTTQTQTVVVSIVRDNDAPVMTAGSVAGTGFTEQGAAVALVSGPINVSDPDTVANFYNSGANIGSLTVALGGYQTGDVLSVADQGNGAGQIGVSGSTISYGGAAFATMTGGSASNLVLTFSTNAATPAAVSALLAQLRYSSTSDDPTVNGTQAGRALTITLNDGGNSKGATSVSGPLTAALSGTIAVAAVNNAPVLGGALPTATFVENGAAVILDGGLTVSDADDTQIAFATVAIGSGFTAGDTLVFVNQGNIAGTYNTGTGVLTLTGAATLAEYQAALRSVTFTSSSDDPTSNGTSTTRSINWTVTDAGSDATAVTSTTRTTSLTVTPQQDAPVLSAGGNLAYTENAASQVIDGTVTVVSDADDTQLTGATISITNGYTAGDVLSFTPANGITLVSNTNGVLTLTGTATLAQYQAALQSVRFASTSEDPTVTSATRTVSWQVRDANSDGAGMASSAVVTSTITLTALNDAPVLSGTLPAPTYTENGTGVVLDADLTISDIDDTQMASATVRITSGLTAGDTLAFVDQSGIAGSYDGATGVLTLTGVATSAQYQAALRSVAFLSTSDDPTNNAGATTRGIGWTVSDAGSDAASASSVSRDTTLTVVAAQDVPVLSAGGTSTYVENAVGQVIDGSVTVVSDADDTQLSGATITISGGYTAGDTLGFTPQNGITIVSNAGGVLTLTGTATLAQYTQALRSVTFSSTSDDPTATAATRTVSWQASDANSDNTGTASSTVVTSTIDVTAANDAPVLDGTLPTVTFLENGTAVVLDAGLTLGDLDDTQIALASVRISSGLTAGDVLAFVNQSGISGNYDAATGVLSLTGAATLAQYQAALRTVTFSSSSDDPTANGTAATRGVTWTVTDAGSDASAATSSSRSTSVTVTPAQDAPLLTAGGSLTYAENALAQPIDATLVVVSDADDTQLSGATITISGGYAAGDMLSFTPQNGISIASNVNGVLTLTGTATLAQYQAALRSVAYASVAEDPTATPATRTVSWQVRDANSDSAGVASSVVVTSTITLTAANDAPVLTPQAGSAAFTENGAAIAVDAGLTVSDADDTLISGGTLAITTGALTSDELAVVVAGSNITGSFDAATGVLTLTGTDTMANYQTVLRSLTYRNSSDDPTDNGSKPSRVITYRLTDANSDGVGAAMGTATKTIDITATQDAPVVTAGGSTTYAENAAAQVIDANVTVASDADDTQLHGATITISGGYTAGDTLGFAPQNGITVASNTNGVLTLTGTATLAQYTQALRSVTFASISDDPTATSATRTISWQVQDANSDGAGTASSAVVTSALTLTPSNDAPALGGALPASTFIENGSAVVLDGNLTLTDLDDTQIGAASVAIATGLTAGDTLVFVNQAGIAGSYDSATGVLSLTGTATLAQYQAALRSVTYTSASDDPTVDGTATTRGIRWTVTDAGSDAAAATSAVRNTSLAVTPAQDAPVVTAGATLTYTENQAAAVIDSTLTVSDVDDTQLTGASVSIAAGLTAGDVLAFVNQSGISGSYDATTGVLTLTGTATLAQYRDALRSVTYASTSDTPAQTSPTRTISWTVVDADSDGAGAARSAAVTSVIALIGVNDVPVANPDTGVVTENAVLTTTAPRGVIQGAVTSGTDTDLDGDTLSVIGVATGTVTTVAGVGTAHTGSALVGSLGTLTLNADGSYTYAADQAGAEALAAGQTATDTFSYAISDGKGGTAFTTLTITVTGVNDAPVLVGTLPPVTQADSTGVSVPTAGGFSDVDQSNTFTYAAAGLPAGLTINSATGVISGTLDHQASQGGTGGVHSVAVTATDSQGATVTQRFDFTVTNPAPVATPDTGSVNENATLIVGAGNGVILGTVGTDTDVDGDALQVIGVSTGTAASIAGVGTVNTGSALVGTLGTLTLNADGSYRYVADQAAADALGAGQTATDTFSYAISDGNGGTAFSTLTITVTGTNDAPTPVSTLPPVTQADSTVVSVPTASGFADLDRNNTFSFTATGLPSGLTIDAATGVISGTLARDASQGAAGGVHAVVVTATDSQGAAVSQRFDFTVTNPAPVATPDTGSVNENDTLTVGAGNGVITGTVGADTDVDGDALTVIGVSTGTAASVAGVGTVNTGSALVGTLGTLTLNADGSYRYVADQAAADALGAGQTATDTFSYAISDGNGGTAFSTLTITVTGVNDAPAAVGSLPPVTQADSTLVNVPTAGAFADTDSNNRFTYSATGLPAGLSIDATTGAITGTLDHEASQGGTGGVHAVVVTATDSQGAAVTQRFAFTVTNPAPVAAPDTNGVTENASLVVGAGNGVIRGAIGTDTDVDGDTLVVTGVTTGTAGSLAAVGSANTGAALVGALGTLTLNADGSYRYVADQSAADALGAGQTATDTFSYAISDGNGGTAFSTLTITVTGSNDAPTGVGTLPPVVRADSTTVSLPTAAAFADVDRNNTFTYGAAGLPAGLTIDNTTGVISGTLDRQASQGGTGGVHAVVVTATDSQGATITQRFDFTVTNPAPVATPDVGSVGENAALVLGAGNGVILGTVGTDTDVDGDVLQVIGVAPGTAGSVAAVGTGNTGTALISTLGTLTLNADGSYRYVADQPAADALGAGQTATDTFSYAITDGNGGTAFSTLTITVTGANDAPTTVGVLPPITRADSTAVTLPTAGAFTDIDRGAALTYRATGLPAGLTIDTATGLITGTLARDASQGASNGAHAVVVTATDGQGASATQQFTFTVTNPAPVANADTGAVRNGETVVVEAGTGVIQGADATGRDSDPDGDTLQVVGVVAGTAANADAVGRTQVGEPLVGAFGTLTLRPDGGYSYVANQPAAAQLAAGAQAADVFSYAISDGNGGTAVATLTITVTGNPPVTPVEPNPPAPPAAAPVLPLPESPAPIQIGANAARSGATATRFNTEPPGVWQGYWGDNRVINLPLPMNPIVYVEVTVEREQALRAGSDMMASGVDVGVIDSGSTDIVSRGQGLGQDASIFVRHAVNEAEREQTWLRGRTLGRDGRVSLSADNLLSNNSLFAMDLVPSTQDSREAAPPPAAADRQAPASEPKRAGAAGFADQLKRASRSVSPLRAADPVPAAQLALRTPATTPSTHQE
jgi:VCBS repeat-containing protein